MTDEAYNLLKGLITLLIGLPLDIFLVVSIFKSYNRIKTIKEDMQQVKNKLEHIENLSIMIERQQHTDRLDTICKLQEIQLSIKELEINNQRNKGSNES